MNRYCVVSMVLGVLALIGVSMQVDKVATLLFRPLVFPAGDGGEYYHVLQAWFDHGSSDVRPQDTERLAALGPVW